LPKRTKVVTVKGPLKRHHESSADLCKYVREVGGDTVVLSFSAGKDAVCAWLQLRRFFPNVVPYYLELIPGLGFVDEGLAYYERFFGAKIHRAPHPTIWRMLNACVFQPPERVNLIDDAVLPEPTYDRVAADVRLQAGVPEEAFTGVGTRTADSPVRHATVKRFGSLNDKRRSFQPIYDWRIADVERELRAAKVKLTVDYNLFGRSFDGIDYRFLRPIRDAYPADYARILEWFPLADLEIQRREYAAKETARG
jgi:hypothetical protein